jgi:hypothetical protein
MDANNLLDVFLRKASTSLLAIILVLCISQNNFAQCNNNNNTACNNINYYNRGHVTPTVFEWQSVNFTAGTPEYISFDGIAGKTYEFRTCSNQNMEITIARENGDNRREYDSNTYYCSGNGDNEYALYTVPTTGRYRVVVSRHGNCAELNQTGTLEYKIKMTRADFLGENYISHTARDNFWIGNIKNLPSGNVPAYNVLFPSNRNDLTEFSVEPLNFDRNFDNKGPGGCGIGSNRFAIYYSTNKYFAPGRYRITVGGDDGFVFGTKSDDVVLGETIHIDEWRNGGYRTRTVDLDLYGFMSLRLYYYEDNSDARISFNIQKISNTNPLVYGDELICGVGGRTQLSGASGNQRWSGEGISVNSDGLVTSTELSSVPFYYNRNYLPRVRILSGNTTVGAKRVIATTPTTFSAYSYTASSCVSKGFIRAYKNTSNFGEPFIWCRDNFSSATTPQVGENSRTGASTVQGGSLRLTSATPSQTGMLTIPNPGNFNSRIISASFNMYMGGGSGADGIIATYGNVGVYFDSYNNVNGNSTTNEIGSTCEPRKYNGQGVSLKVVDANNNSNVLYCLGYGYDLRDRWSNIMLLVIEDTLSIIINGNYVLDNVPISQLSGNRSTWNWSIKGMTGGLTDEHRIDDLSIVSFNDGYSFYEYSANSTNGTNGDWYSNATSSTDITNLDPGTYTLRVRSKFALNRTPCFTPHVIGTYEINVFSLSTQANSTGIWTSASIWSRNSVPGINSCVTIPSGVTVVIPAYANAAASTIIVKPGGRLMVQSGAKLRLAYNIINENTDPNSVVFESDTNFIQIYNPSTTIFNSGKVTVKRTTNPMDKYGYTYWGSPVMGQNTISGIPLYPGANAAYSWNTNPGGTDPDGLIGWTSHHGEMLPGQGYILRAPQNLSPWNQQIGGVWQKAAVTASFIGVPNNGDYNVAIVPSASGLIPHYNAKMTYLSNPYPATIHVDKFFTEYGNGIASPSNAKIIPTVYFWTHATTPIPAVSGGYTYPTADFASYTMLGGTAAVNDVLAVRPRGYIAPGQGFFVQGMPSGGSVTLKNTYKFNGFGTNATVLTDSQFFRLSPNDNEEYLDNEVNSEEFQNDSLVIEKHRFWLDLKSENNIKFKEILVGYSNLGTDEVDGLDGLLHSAQLPFQLYTKIGSELFAIQSLALPFDENDIIPLGMKIDQEGNYSISLSDFDGLFEEQSIYLKDKLLNKIHDLREGDYRFYSEIGNFEERFEIMFKSTLSVHDLVPNQDWIVFKQNEQFIVESRGFVMQEIKVYDVLGKKLYANQVNHDKHIIPVIRGNQVLIVKVITANGDCLSKKIIN